MSNLKYLVYIIFINFIVGNVEAQILYDRNVELSMLNSFYIQEEDRVFESRTGLEQERLLGNLENKRSYCLSFNMVDNSKIFQPGITFTYTNYSFSPEINNVLYDLKLNDFQVGLRARSRLYGNDGLFQICSNVEAGIGLQYLNFLEDFYTSTIDDQISSSTIYTELRIAGRSEFTFVPYARVGLDFSFRVYEFIQIRFIASFQSVTYPHFDDKSPLFFLEGYRGIGLSYLLNKDKRYYNE